MYVSTLEWVYEPIWILDLECKLSLSIFYQMVATSFKICHIHSDLQKQEYCTFITIGGSRGARPAHAPPFAWHPSSLADLGGHAWCMPPHLPGILVFDDILGHIV